MTLPVAWVVPTPTEKRLWILWCSRPDQPTRPADPTRVRRLAVRGVRGLLVPVDARLLRAEGGRLFEQWVAQELLARASYLGRGHRVSFWRLASGAEVDFIWETPREDIPIEVKWTERPRPEDARHVERFLDDHAGRARRGFVVCSCTEPQKLSARVTAIPWPHL